MTRVIKLFYELRDADTGDILESNFGQQEIAFVTGKEQVLAALENGVLNSAAGDELNIKIKAAEAFGPLNKDAIQKIAKEQFAGIELSVGMELFGEGDDGQMARVIVKEIAQDEVTVDFNHPYAGRDLEFNIKISENREASADEALTGVPAGVHVCGCGDGGCGSHSDDECCGGAHHDEHGGGCCGKHH